ncbi:MAG: DUF1631 family protein [Burkholderiaceae bacterium]
MAADFSSSSTGRSTDGEATPAQDVPADPLTRAALMKDCREYLVSQLSEMVAGALTRIADDLMDNALRSLSRFEQQAMMEAVALVRSHRDQMAATFRDAFVDSFERRAQGQSQDSAPMPDGELSLIDDSVLSGKLNVDRLVHRSRSRLDPDEVLGMRARLAALLEREWFEENEHPAAPEAVYEALKQAVSAWSGEPAVQAAILDAFEPHVTAQLNQVYQQANERLRMHRVMPKIRRPVLRARAADARSQRTGGGSDGSADAGAGAMPGVMPGAMSGGAAAGRSAAAAPTVEGFAAAMQDPILQWQMSLEQLGRGIPAARDAVARMLTDPDSFGVADLPLPDVQSPLLQSLSGLQSRLPSEALADAAGVPSGRLGAQVAAQMSDRARDQGSPLDQLTVEIVSMVFDYIYADPRLGDLVKNQLLRLQVVAVKAALIDRSFFARRAHPMRQLIDRITEMATDPDVDFAVDSPLSKGLAELIGWILSTFDQDLSTFDEALCRLAELAEQEQQRRAERIAGLTREAERNELRAQETARAQQLLQQRCDESTPGFLKQFLDDWWAQVMAELAVAEPEPERMSAAEALHLAEALIWSVAPKLADEVSRLAVMLPRILQGLGRGLSVIAMPEAPRQAFFNELLRVHTSAIATAKSAQAQRVAVFNATARVRMRSDGELQFQPTRTFETTATRSPESLEPAPVAQARSRLAGQVQRGDRLEIDEDGQTLRFKLAWISPSQKLYVLSRHPDEARSLDAVAFARLFESGRARVTERRSATDAAIRMAAANAALPRESTPATPTDTAVTAVTAVAAAVAVAGDEAMLRSA